MKKILSFLLLLVVLIIFLSGCVLGQILDGKDNTKTLTADYLVDISSFPDGWSSTYCTSSVCKEDNGISSAEIDFFISGEEGHVYEEVVGCVRILNAPIIF